MLAGMCPAPPRRPRFTPLWLAACVLWLSGWWVPAAADTATVAAHDVLAAYVARPDGGGNVWVRSEGRYRGADWVELILTSQTWRGEPWRHQLYLIRPAKVTAGRQQALLFVAGSKWRPAYEQPPAEVELPKGADLYLGLANRLGSPVAILKQVPNQPLLGGLKEDALIAYTLDQYLRTGDRDWPLLLPMVKSVVRAMDAVEREARQRWAIEIDGFTVTGASKRGWTTWLSAAVDPRVRAIAPIVFDVLNMEEQLQHQRDSWQGFSEQIVEYTARDLPKRLATPDGQKLLEIVDPYTYRDQFRQPKFVLLATNDRFWPVDAAQFYWNQLPEPRYLLYLPNQGHKLTDIGRISAALNAVHQQVARGRPLPDLDWQWQQANGQLQLTAQPSPAPAASRIWVARSKSRDFREARWRSFPLWRHEGRYAYQVPVPDGSYVAAFAEMVFGRGTERVYLSTLPAIAGGPRTTPTPGP